MTPSENFTLQQRGPETFDEAVYVKNAFASAVSRALISSTHQEQRDWLAEADTWKRWLPECLMLTQLEIRRRMYELPAVVILYDPSNLEGLNARAKGGT